MSHSAHVLLFLSRKDLCLDSIGSGKVSEYLVSNSAVCKSKELLERIGIYKVLLCIIKLYLYIL